MEEMKHTLERLDVKIAMYEQGWFKGKEAAMEHHEYAAERGH
jgi:hypothetical protein